LVTFIIGYITTGNLNKEKNAKRTKDIREV